MLSPEARRGREKHEFSRHNFDVALKAWQAGKLEEKKKLALGVLANAHALGKRLIELVDLQTADAIKTDAGI